MSFVKILLGLAFVVVIGIFIKAHLPLIPELSIEGIRSMAMTDILKLGEALLFAVISAGLVLQESMDLVQKIGRSDHGHGESPARWWNLLYVLAALGASAFLYLGYRTASGGV
jgi:hypothetical protein